MASFAINQTLVTRESAIVVDAGLRPGLHRFRLVVSDDQGLSSRPDEVVVQISVITRQGGFMPVPRLRPDPVTADPPPSPPPRRRTR
jgi:hypothetical protein